MNHHEQMNVCTVVTQNPVINISPCGHKSGKVRRLVEVHPLVGLLDKPGLLAKGPNDAGTLHRFIEVSVDGRAAYGLQPPQLTGCGDVEALWTTVEK